MNNIPIIPSSVSSTQSYQSLLLGVRRTGVTQQVYPEKALTSSLTGQLTGQKANIEVPESQKTNYEKSVGTLIDIQA